MCIAVTDHVNGSDSDTNLDDDDAPEYYQPISAVDDNEDEASGRINDTGGDEDRQENGEIHSERWSNGYHAIQAETGMSSLNPHEDLERNKSSSEDEDEQEEEEEEAVRMGVTSDSAITRAFREDENRRNAPLTPENASRVMEAMRGISFTGLAPDWADQIPEHRWIDQLRRLRQPPPQA
ncbi:hypothetical protein FNV43_RR05303 [Rhamnella rubrinervis]|uniref:Uncharacterized protein n=1 Tax=Rhamnella rubrinervis TaxID=2594499 RepID=A0A8K0HLX0_9ROSA|nr:hypothetical protein FNV43_RR05303 [Rhamnella rubrinervis]